VQGEVLKSCAAALAPSLSRLFNCSLQQGALPQGWKTATVVPIPKGGEKTGLENYRPINMTSLVSKALEKLVRDKIQCFISIFSILFISPHSMIHSEHYKKYTIFDKKYIKTQYNNQKLKYSQKFSIKSQVCVQKK
jgi:hypothetical protein